MTRPNASVRVSFFLFFFFSLLKKYENNTPARLAHKNRRSARIHPSLFFSRGVNRVFLFPIRTPPPVSHLHRVYSALSTLYLVAPAETILRDHFYVTFMYIRSEEKQLRPERNVRSRFARVYGSASAIRRARGEREREGREEEEEEGLWESISDPAVVHPRFSAA